MPLTGKTYRPTCHVAGPYQATEEQIGTVLIAWDEADRATRQIGTRYTPADARAHVEARNIRRAVHLGRLAVLAGYAPLVPHVASEPLHGKDSDPDRRAEALECGEGLAYATSIAAGAFWGILRDDGTASEGVSLEMAAYYRGPASDVALFTWEHWIERAELLAATNGDERITAWARFAEKL